MTKTLSNVSSVAEEQQNTTGVLDPILAIQPENGTRLVIQNAVERGQQTLGVPVYGEFRDSDGNPIPLESRLALQFEQPADDSPSVISEPFENVRPYRSLDLKEQQNTDYVDRVKHVLRGKGLVVGDNDTLYVSVESSAQVDWSNTRVQFAESAVTEV
jgi:hypothetical protein